MTTSTSPLTLKRTALIAAIGTTVYTIFVPVCQMSFGYNAAWLNYMEHPWLQCMVYILLLRAHGVMGCICSWHYTGRRAFACIGQEIPICSVDNGVGFLGNVIPFGGLLYVSAEMYLYANVGACLVLHGFFLFVVVYLCAYIFRQPFLQTSLAKGHLLGNCSTDLISGC